MALSSVDRVVFVRLYRLAPKVIGRATILQPEAVIRWRRAEHIGAEIRTARGSTKDSRRHSYAPSRDERCQPPGGAPRIHGELLKLGIDVGQTTVAIADLRRTLSCRVELPSRYQNR